MAALYQRFLTGHQSTGFIAFERKLVFPEPPNQVAGSEAFRNPSIPLKLDYRCFLWNGSKFLSVSSDAPITNETDIVRSATSPTRISDFCGYDGETYWNLRANVMRVYRKVDAGQYDQQVPIEINSTLAVFTREEELSLARGGRQSNRPLASILDHAAESRRVAQMGFSLPVEEPPTLVASNQMLLRSPDGRSQTVVFTGPREQPEILEYYAPSNTTGSFRVIPGFQTNTLTIDSLSSRSKLRTSTIRYRVLAASVPSSLPASMFSWQSYRPTAGELIRETPAAIGKPDQHIDKEKQD